MTKCSPPVRIPWIDYKQIKMIQKRTGHKFPQAYEIFKKSKLDLKWEDL